MVQYAKDSQTGGNLRNKQKQLLLVGHPFAPHNIGVLEQERKQDIRKSNYFLNCFSTKAQKAFTDRNILQWSYLDIVQPLRYVRQQREILSLALLQPVTEKRSRAYPRRQ